GGEGNSSSAADKLTTVHKIESFLLCGNIGRIISSIIKRLSCYSFLNNGPSEDIDNTFRRPVVRYDICLNQSKIG
ncbi:hypothetical protein ACTHTN_19020, partial [Neisseria sp. P0015.S006]